MKKSIAVIGSGLSGITVASIVKKKFHIDIFEKSRGVGGRMSTRKEPPFVFDHGAQFFKIKTFDFMNFISELLTEKIIQPWNFKLAYFSKNDLKKIKVVRKKDNFFVGVPNMDSIVKYLSINNNVILNTKIEKIIKVNNRWYLYDQSKKKYGQYDWVILSLPAKQSLDLITKNVSFYSAIEKIKMKSCFSLMVGINESLNLNYDAALIEDNDIAWFAINNSKPGRTKKNSLLINSSYDYAAKNINLPKDKVLKHLLDIISDLIKHKFSNTSFKKLHQWKYVEAENPPNDNYFIDYNEKIAVCGDWFIDSRVEGAFTSANELSKEIL